jgi:hypothetical protein
MNTTQLSPPKIQNKFIVNCCKNPSQHIQNVMNKDNTALNPMDDWYYICNKCKSKWKYDISGETIVVKSLL